MTLRAAMIALALASCAGRQAPGAGGGCREGSVTEVRGEWRSVRAGGRKRSFILDAPAGPADERRPLVIVFHGLGGDAEGMREWADMDDEALERGFVAVHPQGTLVHLKGMMGRGWQIAEDDTREVALVEAILSRVGSEACIDPDRVYAVGFSNGGFLVHFLACMLPGRIGGIGAVAGGLDGIEAVCGQAGPIRAAIVNGAADDLVDVQAGRDSAALWAARSGCSGEKTEGECTRRTGCEEGAGVLYCELPDTGHTWPPDATDLVLDFLLGSREP